MPDQHHPDHDERPAGSFPAAGAPDVGDPFEQLLRTRLHQLAEHAPATVHSLDELRVEHTDRLGGRAARRRDGRHRRTAGIGATVAALAGAIGFTTVALTGAGTAGAATPEEAVRTFLDAAQAEDVFGMIDALDPEEVPAARAAAEQGRAGAVSADLVTEGFELDGVDGVDLAFADLTFTTEVVTDSMSVVTADGAVSFSFDPETFPLGSELAEALSGELEAVSEDVELSDVVDPAMLATVERDGRWYVSVSYTIGEYARREAEQPMPATPLMAVGADSPEAAAERVWSDLLTYDLPSILATAAPGEGDAVLAYAPLLVDAWEDESPLLGPGYDMSLDDVTFEVTGSGDRRRVAATGFTLSGSIPDPNRYLYLDPTLPTVINTADYMGIVVLEPGVPIPATLEGLTIDTDMAYPEGDANYTYENPDGSVQPLPELPPDAAPAPITIVDEGDCTTYSGRGATYLLGSSSVTTDADGNVVENEFEMPSDLGFEQVGDESWQDCGPGLPAGGLLSLFGLGGLAELPSLQVVEVDGQWYTAPVGSFAELLLGVVRSADDGSLLDSSVAWIVLGTDRQGLSTMLRGTSVSDLAESCQALVVAGADGIVTGIIDDPDLALVRSCATGPMFEVFSDGVMAEPAPFPTVEVPTSEVIVTETTVTEATVTETTVAEVPSSGGPAPGATPPLVSDTAAP